MCAVLFPAIHGLADVEGLEEHEETSLNVIKFKQQRLVHCWLHQAFIVPFYFAFPLIYF